MHDGAIVFSTELDNDGMEKDLARLKKQISSDEEKIALKRDLLAPLVEQSQQLQMALDKARAKLYEMQNAPVGMFSKDQIAEQKETVGSLQSEWNRVQKRVESYQQGISDTTVKLERNKAKAGEIAAQLAQVEPSSERMADAVGKAHKNANRFALRLREVVRSALVFTLITQTLAKFREWMGKVIKTNDEASASIAQLKGALLTLAQPLVEFILPAFAALVNILARLTLAVAGLMSALFGKTIDQSKAAAAGLQAEADALEETGGAAKKAGQSLASFDEINTLSGETSGGAGASAASTPDFGFETSTLESDMTRILNLAKIIGAALLAWKLSGTLTDKLGTFVGMLIAIEGGVLLAKGAMDAWNNGVSWDNIQEMLLGTFLLVAGISAVLGATAGGIALVTAGFAMMVVGIKDVLEQGWTMHNLLLTIAGILAAGMGIGVLTGSWIPLLVAGIGSILLAITVLTGNGGQLIENLKQIFRGFITFVDGIMSGDLSKVLDGAKTMVKGAVNVILTVVGSLVNAVINGLNWLVKKINSISFTVPDWIPLVGGKSFSPKLPSIKEWKIPQLATGAVIPPNREFLAVLGDQTSGTNIEAPEGLIRKIVREEAGMNTQLLQAILEAILEGKNIYIDGEKLSRNQVRHINKMSIAAGKSVLIV